MNMSAENSENLTLLHLLHRNQSGIARDRNTTILAIGVGEFNENELIQIAGNQKNVFSVRKFSELEKVHDKLKSFIKFETLESKMQIVVLA